MPEHPTCARLDWDELLDDGDEGLHAALRTVAKVFQPVAVVAPLPPRKSQYGPCTRCHNFTLRYGPFAHAWCPDCRKGTP